MKRFHLSQANTVKLINAVFKHHNIAVELPTQNTFSTILSGKKKARWNTSKLEKVGKYLVVSQDKVISRFRYNYETKHSKAYQLTILGHVSRDYDTGVNKHINFSIGEYWYQFPINHYRKGKSTHQAPAKTGRACLVGTWLKKNKEQVSRIKETLNLDDVGAFNALIPFIHSHKIRKVGWRQEDYIYELQQFKNKRVLIDNAINKFPKSVFKRDASIELEAYLLPIQYSIKEYIQVLDMVQLFLFIRCPYSKAVFIRTLPESFIKPIVVYRKKNKALVPSYTLSVTKHVGKLVFDFAVDFKTGGSAAHFNAYLNIEQSYYENKQDNSQKPSINSVGNVGVGERVTQNKKINLATGIALPPLITPFAVRDKSFLTNSTINTYLQGWVLYLNQQFARFTKADEAWFYNLRDDGFVGECCEINVEQEL